MEKEILELEKKYWSAMESHDYETVNSLTRFPCIIAGESGVQSVDEASFKKMFDSGEGSKIKVVGISHAIIQVIENTALIAYQIEFAHPADGKPSSSTCACSSTWLKENGRWLCCLHTEAEIKK